VSATERNPRATRHGEGSDDAVARLEVELGATVVREHAALAMPDYHADLVPAGWWSEIAGPVIEAAETWEELDDLDTQLEAFIGFAEAIDKDYRVEFEKAKRIIERRRGEFLGVDVTQGRRTDLDATSPCPEELDVSDAGARSPRWDVIRPHLDAARGWHEVTQAACLRLVRTGSAAIGRCRCECCGHVVPCDDGAR
jgi:hypothetical protein